MTIATFGTTTLGSAAQAVVDKIVRNDKGQIVGTIPQPRPVFSCECGNHCFVALTKGFVTLVSPEDANLLGAGAWWASGNGRLIYAMSGCAQPRQALHEAIVGKVDGMDIDHANRNTLDNRRSNLRHVSRSANNRNRERTSSRSSYFGVCFHPHSGLWRAYVNVGGKQISGGYFRRPDEAAKARDSLCRERGLITARLNFERDGGADV
jgi:hypothetical protein